MKRRLLAAVSVVALVGAAPAGFAMANGDEALDAIDHVVHEWDDGDITAEVAMEEIDHIIHDLSAAERTGVLAEIDDIVHAWEDGDMTAEAAMEAIDDLVHAAGHDDHDDEHADDEHADDEAAGPAKVGSAGLVGAGSQTNLLLVLGGAGLMVALLGAGRVATTRNR